ncbi:hypothetical protein NDJ78_21595 [Vibrio parahaemolyticus]|uniref:hypothetical protein n=1 Tax=Vibrio parahaemolyticus TaxID=670 RepID=UPI002160C31C|nr:hypothetical protein [Vibrio parahaemolyticus]MCS0192761.1 hypothetical protein [Vibrio parahaemolyticus]
MRSYKLILPESMAGHITYSKEKLRACSGLSKYFNVKWGKDVLAKIVLPCDHQAILSYRNLEGFLPNCPFGMGKNKLVAHSSIC